MPITIQEIIASDTISQLVDKTNFNFDQLLLNGGGPPGPIGLPGPTGPAGGRGPKGSTWYEDASLTTPGVSPNVTAPTVTPLSGDYYLQFNGQVWEYNGTTWVITTVDLQGPAGPAGTTGGFGSFFGQGSISNFNTVLPTPKGIGGTGANLSNEGILSVLVGGAASNTDTADSGVTLTSAYKLTDALALSMASDVVSLMVHQKNTGSRALVFHGGADATNSELMEQTQLGILSAIKLEIDDRLTVDVPKVATTVVGMSNTDVIGYQVNTLQRSQSYVAGNQIIMSSGNNAAPYGYANENSNIEITVNTGSSGGTGNKFRLVTTGSAGSGVFEIGNNVLINQAPQIAANINANAALTAGFIDLVSSQTGKIQLWSGGGVAIDTASNAPFTGSIDVAAGTGGLNLSSTGQVSMLVKGVTNASVLTIQNQYNGANNATGQIYILGNKDIALRKQTASAINAPSIILNYTNATAPHTRFVGEQTWTKVGTASQGPILSDDGGSIYQYNNVDGVLTQGVFESFRRVGRNNITDYLPGGSLEQWMLGTSSFSGVKGNQISISVGDESLTNPVPTTYSVPTSPSSQAGSYDPSYDSSLGIEVRTADGLPGAVNQYFNANAQKISIAAPFVFKRDQGRNSGGNNAPTYDSPQYLNETTTGPPYGGQGNYPSFGLDLMSNFSVNPTAQLSFGMPTTADIAKAPLIFLRFGFGVGQRTEDVRGNPAGQTFLQAWDASFKFPVGAYPGQRIIVIIENYATQGQYMNQTPPQAQATTQTPTNSSTFICYGNARVNFPMNRKYDPPNGVWTDWYENGSAATNAFFIPDGTRGYQQVLLGTDAVDAADSRVKRRTIEIMWNGSVNQTWARYQSMGNPNGMRISHQGGWVFLSDSQAAGRNEFNINTF